MYSSVNAVSYALNHYINYNNLYPNYAELDSTNFVSQCLFAGGVPMQQDSSKNLLLNWYCLSKNSIDNTLISSTWYSAEHFYKYWSNNANKYFTFTLKDLSKPNVLNSIEPGDPITIFKYNKISSCVIVIRREGNHILCASHAEDTVDTRLVDFNLNQFRVYKLGKINP